MPLTSMTGFARAVGAFGHLQWTWEIKTVNGKSLDIRLRLPQGFDSLDSPARAAVSSRITRGTCHATLTVQRSGGVPAVRINQQALNAVIEAAQMIKDQVEARPLSLDGLFGLRGVVEITDPAENEAGCDQREIEQLIDGLVSAVDDLVATRRAEGTALYRVLEDKVTHIDRLARQAEALPSRQPEAIKAKLNEQLRLLLDASVSLDSDRLHQEAILLAGKADIREEIDRLLAHVDAARDLMSSGVPVGRKLDFLAQEFGREANTLCSKSNDIALTRIGLDLKTTIEQFREQVQNIE